MLLVSHSVTLAVQLPGSHLYAYISIVRDLEQWLTHLQEGKAEVMANEEGGKEFLGAPRLENSN